MLKNIHIDEVLLIFDTILRNYLFLVALHLYKMRIFMLIR